MAHAIQKQKRQSGYFNTIFVAEKSVLKMHMENLSQATGQLREQLKESNKITFGQH
jgi:hypothetical protein